MPKHCSQFKSRHLPTSGSTVPAAAQWPIRHTVSFKVHSCPLVDLSKCTANKDTFRCPKHQQLLTAPAAAAVSHLWGSRLPCNSRYAPHSPRPKAHQCTQACHPPQACAGATAGVCRSLLTTRWRTPRQRRRRSPRLACSCGSTACRGSHKQVSTR